MKNGEKIFLGDIHFGIKSFSLSFLDNQIDLFEKQIFPYMKKNNIKEIYQLGDLFDNRTTADIIWLDTVKKKFSDRLVEEDYALFTLLGNHDIALRESREISLIETMAELYPNNFKIFKERTTQDICGRKTYIVPWIVKSESLNYEEIKDKEVILGHFEIRDFSMVKGHIDTSSSLTKEFFQNKTKVDIVLSGHYHIKNTYGDIKYLGTPFQLNWNDFNEEKGFYSWDGDALKFFENETSKKYIKVKYNDENKKPLEIEGLTKNILLCTFKEFKQIIVHLKKHELKFFVNKAKDKTYEEILYTLKENNVFFTLIDNQKISEIIGADYLTKFSNEENNKFDIENTRELILKTVKVNKPDLLPLVSELFAELDTKKEKDI